MGIRLLCVAGTRLASTTGPVAVESLSSGACLLAADGGAHRVHWVGRTRLMPAELAGRPADWPVQIAADALADGLPACRTVVLADQMLPIPGHTPTAAKWLVDGHAITRTAPDGPLDILWLDLDTDANPDPLVLHDPRATVLAATADLRAVRLALMSRTGHAPGPLRGSLDIATRQRVAGWAADDSGHPVTVEVLVDGVPHAPVTAGGHRADLARAGIAGGRAAFLLPFDPPLGPAARHLVAVRRACDGAELPGSPALLDAEYTVAARAADVLGDPSARAPLEALVRAVAARLEVVSG